jgi:hypothetical protein
MTTSIYNERLHTDSVRLSGLPTDYRNINDETEQSPPKLRPGAAVAFAIASVVVVLSFIEIVFS